MGARLTAADVVTVLLAMATLLIAARALGELARRFRQPAVSGSVLAKPGSAWGELGREMFYLRQGEVSILAAAPGGGLEEVARLGAGQCFGEMAHGRDERTGTGELTRCWGTRRRPRSRPSHG
jgi:hypothetical protein